MSPASEFSLAVQARLFNGNSMKMPHVAKHHVAVPSKTQEANGNHETPAETNPTEIMNIHGKFLGII